MGNPLYSCPGTRDPDTGDRDGCPDKREERGP